MGIMPHRNVGRALELALGLDIPFWPQLPNVSFREDMYAQTARGFPGVLIDDAAERVLFDTARFEQDLAEYSENMADPGYFRIDETDSAVYRQFLGLDLSRYCAIRGQLTGPVSFGFRVVDEAQRPIIYNDSARPLLFEFIQKKCNAQYAELKSRNRNAFVWADEPGLGWVFSGLSGYDDIRAREDYVAFMQGLEGVRALHLCANVNLPFLLELGVELVSFDAYQIEVMPRAYAESVARYLGNGGILAWGIIPTDSDSQGKETVESLSRRLLDYWSAISGESGIALEHIAMQSLLAPARCCLKNIGRVGSVGEAGDHPAGACPVPVSEEHLVETAFQMLRDLSLLLRERFKLEPAMGCQPSSPRLPHYPGHDTLLNCIHRIRP